MKKHFILLILLFVAPLCSAPAAGYPNELSGLELYSKSPFSQITPLVSDISDVRRILGAPSKAHDLSNYVGPYPGDSKAETPIFQYAYSDAWNVIIYFVSSSSEKESLPISFLKKVYSIDFLPKKRLVITPPGSNFRKKHIVAADASWNEYSDSYGLSYQIYTSKTPYGDDQPGDLNRVSYRASDSETSKAQQGAAANP